MDSHRRFTDAAGRTRHCWECVHAKDWESGFFGQLPVATCELHDVAVNKYDGPGHCLDAPWCVNHDDGSGRD